MCEIKQKIRSKLYIQKKLTQINEMKVMLGLARVRRKKWVDMTEKRDVKQTFLFKILGSSYDRISRKENTRQFIDHQHYKA